MGGRPKVAHMRRLLRVGRSRPLPEVEARIAVLSEELPLTAMFAAAMARDGRTRAALGVIDEQRASLRRAQTEMLRSLAARKRRRIQAALAGSVAAVMIASGSYAMIQALRPEAPKKAELISRATAKIEEARLAASATEFTAIVEEVQESIFALPSDALADPETKEDVATLLGRAQTLVASAPNAAELLAKVQQIAKKVDVTPAPAEPPAASTTAPNPSVAPPDAEQTRTDPR